MASLSFDNLSSEHLGYWYPIKLKLTPNEVYYKNEKTSKSYHFESNLIKTAEWLYRARGYGLCVKLTTRKRHYFDGFAENEFEKISRYFEESYGIKVKNVETCLKGWNWGKPQFEDEHMQFLIDGMRGFDINLKDVFNANLTKNELTLQFQTSDEAFSIYEMRFATVSTNENVMNDMHQMVIREANILEANGDALVSLKEMHCLQPRGRYEIKLYPQFIHLRGKTYDYSVPKDNFLRFYLLPHPDERQIFFVIQVDPPITHGQTRYHFIILLFNNEDEINIDLNCQEKWLNETYNGALDMRLSGVTYEVVTKLYKTLYNQKLTVPNKFESKQKNRALTCNYKTTIGFLYPLDKGFIFVPKPALSIRSDEITIVNLSRTMQRTFDFDIETSAGVTHTFTAIDKSEYNLLLEFVKSKKYVLSSSGGHERREDWSSSGESQDEYLERMKNEGKRNRHKDVHMVTNDDDDEDDEEDEDFNPDEGAESSVAEEYDSEVNTSSTDDEGKQSDGSGGGGVATDKPAKTKESLKMNQAVRPKTDKRSEPKTDKRSEPKPDKRSEPKPDKKRSETTKPDKKRGGESSKGDRALAGGDGKRKKVKKPKDPNAPKKPMTAYFLFSKDVRAEVKTTMSITETSKLSGERWKTLTDAEKEKYSARYKAAMVTYNEELKKYKATIGGSVVTPKATSSSARVPEIATGKISTGMFKSEEFVESSESSSME